ncbi:cation transporter [Oceanirhabdus seepicola]|uniref:Cation transporter n=1 Tax=Oceanirhabdus seepicola TaxID=2828781 RepID=A0A9J6P1N6_9CLOT|nr:cation transporter [Oceanirhabdus seepicola]MCM1989416.1 cation transporter [Oceanirhabdus seepicola]
MNIQKTEAKGLKIAVIILLFMGTLGIIVSQISNSAAILIDGVFSIISAISTLIAIKVSSLLTKENEKYPFGYAGYEPLYVALRSFLLTITVLMALLDCVSKIITYISTGSVPQVDAKIFMIYVIFIALMYVVLNIHYSKYCKITEGKSELLSAEKFNAKANSLLMLGVGGSFIFIGLLKFTPLKFLVPISDSIIVFFIALMVAIDSIKLFSKTIAILGGKGISEEEKNELLESLKKIYLYELNINKLRVHKAGKTAYVVVDVCINDENISKTIIKDINKTIKNSVNEKYSVNHTFVNFI